MKKTIILAAALVLVLTGCGIRGRVGDGLNGYTDWLVQKPNPLFPNVFVDASERLIIDQEPIHLKGYGDVTIAWALPAGSPYRFRDLRALSSIRRNCDKESELVNKITCTVAGSDGKTLQCPFPARFFDANVKYCYSLTVINTGTKNEITTDPSIVSD